MNQKTSPFRALAFRITATLAMLAGAAITASAQTTTVILNDSFADGTRTTQNLPASADWFAGTNVTIVSGAAKVPLSSSRTVLTYFTGTTSNPISLAGGESLKLEFTVQFSAFDSTAAASTYTLNAGLLRSVANSAAVAGTGFTPEGAAGANTNARVSADYGSSNPNSHVFTRYNGYGVFTRALDAAATDPVSFRARTGSDDSLIGKPSVYTAIASTPASATSTAMAANTDYRGTLTLTKTTGGGMNLTYNLVKVSDSSVVMTHSVQEAAATCSDFDTAAFYFNLTSATPPTPYDVFIKNVTVSKIGAPPAGDPPAITTNALPNAMQNVAYNATVAASNSPTSFGATGLPTGLGINASGLISGIPTVSGSFNIALSATNAGGASPVVTLPLIVTPAPTAVPLITSTNAATAYVGAGFTYTITATNSPTSYGASGYPAGFTFNPATGVISGTATPSDVNTYAVAISATNTLGPSLPFTLNLSVQAPPAPVAAAPTGVTTTGFIAKWGAITGATGYFIDIATDISFAAGSIVPGYDNLDVGTATLRAVTGLTTDTNYYYRVRATYNGGVTANSNIITVATAAMETILVNDIFTDADRIGGEDGSNTSSSRPKVSDPTVANTQWVASVVRQLVASSGGMRWNFSTTSAIGLMGYFPKFTVNNGQTVTIKLDFTTGTLGAGAPNNLRIALLNGTARGRRETDGFSVGSSGDAAFAGDVGYAFCTESTVGGNSTTPSSLSTYKRVNTNSLNLLGAIGDWGSSTSSSGTPASGHIFASDTPYSLIITLTRNASTSLTITSQISGGNFSTGLVNSTTDTSLPISSFDTIGFRFGTGSNQFASINITGLKITTTGDNTPTDPPLITSNLTVEASRGTAFTYTITADNSPTKFTATGLPPGLLLPNDDEATHINTTGVIMGTPAVTGTFEVTLTAYNAIGSDSKTLILHVTGGESEITTVVPAGTLNNPTATVFDASGNGYLADVGSGTIKKVDATGAVTTFATIPQLAVLTTDASGNFYTAGNDGAIRKVLPDGTVVSPALATGVTTPGGIAVASDGTVYVSKTAANTIVKITSAGAVTTIAGAGAAGHADGVGTAATFDGPTGLALNQAAGKLYVADTVNCTIREINLATSAVTTIAGQPGVRGDAGDTGIAGKALNGTLDTPEALAIDAAGLLYIADTGNNLIRGFEPVSGALSTLAGNTGDTTLSDPAGLAFDPSSGLLYVADTGSNAMRLITIKPIVATLLADMIVPLGTNITLHGAAWASPDAEYQWYLHGEPLQSATNSTLSVNVQNVTDSGIYTVAAFNITGTTTSSMRLTVTGNDSTPGPNAGSPNPNSSGGGGAPSLWLLGAMALLACIRKINTRRARAATLLAGALSLFTIHYTPLASAQQTPPPASAISEDLGEVITLSAFEVTGQSVKGYTASESITGTRVASLLRELPFNVNVVTSEYISDFNALELADQLSNVSSFSPSENIGQYQLRGYQGSTQLVDGFRRVGLTGVTVTDRVEVIKGPAASIYGQTQPGGAINTIRKKPSATPKYGLTMGFGTNDQARASFYASGPLGNSRKLFYRIDTEYRTADRQQEFAKSRNEYAAVQLMYKPSAKTTIGLFIDYADRHDFNSSQLAIREAQMSMADIPSWFNEPLDGHYLYQAKAYTQSFSSDYNFYDRNLPGPNANKYSRLTAGSLSLDHKFSDIWSLRASFNMSNNPTHGEKATSHYYPYGERPLKSTSPEAPQAEVKFQPQHDEGTAKATGFQIDNLFRFSTGPIKHQLLVTGDYYRNSSVSLSRKWANAAFYDPANPYSTRAYTRGDNTVTNFQSIDYLTWEEDPNRESSYSKISDNTKTISADYGFFISERATFFQSRVIALLGVRYDYVDCFAEHRPTDEYPEGEKVDYAPDAWSYQAGLTGIVSRNISLYANASSSFDPQPQLDERGQALPNIKSDGYEFGVKLTLLAEKLSFTLNRFHIRQRNLATTTSDYEGNKIVILTGEQISQGYEVDFNWQATRALNFVGGYGYVDAEITDAGKLNWLNGTTPRRVPKHNLGLSARYEFLNGPLKGFYATAGATYYSRSLINSAGGTNAYPLNDTIAASPGNMAKQLVYNRRFPNGGLPYPYLPENAIVTLVTPEDRANNIPAILYWTDVANPTTSAEMLKYSYAAPAAVGVTQIPNGLQDIYNRSSIVWKLGIGYKFKSGSGKAKLSHKVQVNMDNVFDEESTLAGGIPIVGRTVMVTYSMSF